MKDRYKHSPCINSPSGTLAVTSLIDGSRYEWSYVSGRISVLENDLLKKEFFTRVLACEGREELLHALADSPVRDYFAHREDLFQSERQVHLYYLERLIDIKRFSPLPLVCEFFQLPYDFINLKNYIKEKVIGIPFEAHLLGRIRKEEWDRLWNEKQTDLPETFVKTVIFLKECLVGEEQAEVFIDSVVDSASLGYLCEIAQQVESRLIEHFARQYQLVKGVEIVWRTLLLRNREKELPFLGRVIGKDFLAKLTHSPIEEWHRVLMEIFPAAIVERLFQGSPREGLRGYKKATDDYLLHEVKPAKYVPFGPERVFGYLVGLTRERFNLQLAVGGRVNRVPQGLLAGRLRESYAEI